mmetsp:Transcript_16737/g.34477  ORF Transcript_16737/g.34477 Transcript_16737/m.34477 type:complete len:308 (+) Transcript_16737:624-1547(+)
MERRNARRALMYALHRLDIEVINSRICATITSLEPQNSLLLLGGVGSALRELVEVSISCCNDTLADRDSLRDDDVAWIPCRMRCVDGERWILERLEVFEAGCPKIAVLLNVDDIPCASVMESKLRALLDTRSDQTLFIATATKREDVPPSLLRSLRLSVDHQVVMPSKAQRCDAVAALGSHLDEILTPSQVLELSTRMPGYDFLDFLQVFYRTQARIADFKNTNIYRRILAEVETTRPRILMSEGAELVRFPPMWGTKHSGLQSVLGYNRLKEEITKYCDWPFLCEKSFARLGIEPPSGILLEGPSG